MLLFACFMICGSAALAAESLLVNGALEDGLRGWAPFWSRTPKTGTATLDRAVRHAGAQAVRIDHKGAQDWSFGQQKALPVTPGQIFAFSAWVQVKGEGSATLGVILRDTTNQVLDWTFGARTTRTPSSIVS